MSMEEDHEITKTVFDQERLLQGREDHPTAGGNVHSTGSNNPSVARYVPGDDVIGRNQYGNVGTGPDWKSAPTPL